MRIVEFVLDETSPDTLEGSFTDDLIQSKTWLCKKLKEGLKGKCARTIYILGSWYGNLAMLLQKEGIVFDEIVLVENDEDKLRASAQLLKPFFKPGKLVFLNTDARDVIYDKPGIIINTSVNDMKPSWYDVVPDGYRVMIQGRDQASGAITKIADMEQFTDMFPMRKVNYLGNRDFTDPETRYTRYMKIGKK
jgi:hypothetical protein